MKTRTMLLTLLAVLFAYASISAQETMYEDDREYRFILGSVTMNDGWTMVVNEGWRVKITRDTKVFNSNEEEISRDSVRGHKWVYVEGPVDWNGDVRAERLYVLPGYVGKDQARKYPFIQIPLD